MIIRRIILFFLFIFLFNFLPAQKSEQAAAVNWLTIEQADSLFDKHAKPFLFDVYTEWCGWCKHMDKTTFANKGIAAYINANFYPVKFDAESFDTVRYQGKVYVNPGVGKKSKHDFAKYLLNGRFSFPTIVYADKERNLYRIPGYMRVKQIEPLLVYFAEDLYKSVSFDVWQNLYYYNYFSVYKDDIEKLNLKEMPDTTGVLQVKTIEEASKLCLKDNKPLLVYFYTDWCQACKIESEMVFKNKAVADLLNEKFNFVKFNAASSDTVKLFGSVFKPTGQGRPHELTYMLLKQSFKFPAFVFIDSKKQKLNEMHGFLQAAGLENVLLYFSEENYKNQTFDVFLKKKRDAEK